MFIPYLLFHMLAVLVVIIYLHVPCLVRAHMLNYQYEVKIVGNVIMIYLWIKIKNCYIQQMHRYLKFLYHIKVMH